MSSVSLASIGGQAVSEVVSVPDRWASNHPTAGQEPGTVLLRVSGGRPLRLLASLLAEASSWSPGASAWHEIALYQRRDDLPQAGQFQAGQFAPGQFQPGQFHGGAIAVALRLCTQPGGAGDLCQVHHAATLADAADWLGAFDPTADLATDLDASDRRLRGVEIALRAAALRQRADRVERQYRAMIGELLFCIEGSGAIEDPNAVAR